MRQSEPSVKFAACECTAAEEDWRLIDRAEHSDCVDIVYECQTCEGQYWTSIDVERAA